MHEFDDFKEECDRAPRLNELSEFFSTTACGQAGIPIRPPQLDRRFFPLDVTFRRFSALHPLRQGLFDKHYLSSIPYRFEKECRMGSAILKYTRAKKGKLKLAGIFTLSSPATVWKMSTFSYRSCARPRYRQNTSMGPSFSALPGVRGKTALGTILDSLVIALKLHAGVAGFGHGFTRPKGPHHISEKRLNHIDQLPALVCLGRASLQADGSNCNDEVD
jgi:hypothetical protein